MSSHAYPLRVDATLEEPLSRWLWLVKWFLVIPHYLVLAFLWPAFAVLSVVAAFAILVTGRYPRGIFEFNVGVLRWTWRVGYYAYSALGTDHYPPFTLADRGDYPAHLEVSYPEHLSRGLVLVKWWLLALPHYIVVAIFVGGGWYFGHTVDERYPLLWQAGLIGILVLVAAVVLLFTGSYPRQIFDLVLGLNRWVLRVAAYAGLMTDEYPPFRLDTGGDDPAGHVLALGQPPEAPAGAPAGSPAGTATSTQPGTPITSRSGPPPTQGTSWGAGRIAGAVIASLLLLLSLGLLLGGAGVRIADSVARDQSGYVMSGTTHFASPGYAATSEEVVFGFSRWADWPSRWLGVVKVTADARTRDGVFVGIARKAAVDRYLAGVAHTSYAGGGRAPRFKDGGSPPSAPADANFWAASVAGSGHQVLRWHPSSGSWRLVVMNRSGTARVSADVRVGGTVPVLGDVGTGLLVGGGVLLVIGGVLLAAVLVRRGA